MVYEVLSKMRRLIIGTDIIEKPCFRVSESYFNLRKK